MNTVYVVMSKQTCYDSWGGGNQLEEIFKNRADAEEYVQNNPPTKWVERICYIEEREIK